MDEQETRNVIERLMKAEIDGDNTIVEECLKKLVTGAAINLAVIADKFRAEISPPVSST